MSANRLSAVVCMHKLSFVVMLLLATSLIHAQSASGPGDFSELTSSRSTHPTPPPVSFGSGGLLFSTRGKAYQLRVHGYVQADGRFLSNDVQGKGLDKFLFRRVRPLFEGTLFKAVDFRFMPDFGQNTPQIQEAYLELKSIPFTKLRVGKFKEPVGLEILKSDRELTFAERSLASDLVPLRYLGAQVAGSFRSNSITYAFGYFNGSNDGANGNFQWLWANEAAARVFLRPFAASQLKAIGDFGLGVAGSAGDHHGNLASLKTPGQSTFFKYSSTTVANGQHNRLSPQAYYYLGPVGLTGEYMISSQDVLNKKTTHRLRNEAWQVTGSVMLTGERNSYYGVRPRFSFAPRKSFRHLGAVELSFRYGQLRVDRNAFPLFANPQSAAREAAERAIGVNWYLNRYIKLVADYEITRFTLASKTATLHDENVLMSRIQLAL